MKRIQDIQLISLINWIIQFCAGQTISFSVSTFRLHNETEAKLRMENHLTFFLTRHPFERLVSAYSDKLTNRTDIMAYRNNVGKAIAKKQAKEYMHGLQVW